MPVSILAGAEAVVGRALVDPLRVLSVAIPSWLSRGGEMSRQILPTIPKRLLNFDGLEIGGSSNIVLAQEVELLHWRELTLMVQVHSHSLSSGAGSIYVAVVPMSRTIEDPSTAFLPSNFFLTAAIAAGVPSPTLLTLTLPTLGSGAIADMVYISGFGV